MNFRVWFLAFVLLLAALTAGTRALRPLMRTWVAHKVAGTAETAPGSARPAPSQDPHLLQNYAFSPETPLAGRVAGAPPLLLEFWRAADAAPQYESYQPSDAERELVAAYLALLPPAYAATLGRRCVGVYFVKNFKGYGLADWLLDSKGAVYVYLLLNAAALKEDLSATLTARERSCFKPGAGAPSVDAGGRYRGLLYSLAHEGAHALDYVHGVTPYADPGLPGELRPQAPLSGTLFWDTWGDFEAPNGLAAFPLRDKVTFYGFNGGPKLAPADAAKVYAGLKASPFASLYGSRNWSDDFAELAALGLITGPFGQPYRIKYGGGSLEPLRSPAAARRAAAALEIIKNIK